MNKVLVIIGPTASGKTAISIKLAKLFQGEIISGDSVQVYRELNIGSAKTTRSEQQGIPHHLIDCCSIKEHYTVFDFQTQGRKLIETIAANGKLPVIAGGTGLYIKALLYDYQFPPQVNEKPNFQHYSNQELWDFINLQDPVAAQKVHINNRQRLETNFWLLQQLIDTNKSTMLQQQLHEPLFDMLIIGLTMDRQLLYQRINQRVEMMIETGLEQEIKKLMDIPDLFNLQAMQAIGYKEWQGYFQGNTTLEETIDQIKTHTRQFAKRQYTWFNNQMPVTWVDASAAECEQQIISIVKDWLNK